MFDKGLPAFLPKIHKQFSWFKIYVIPKMLSLTRISESNYVYFE
jgi:hypothetical protein